MSNLESGFSIGYEVTKAEPARKSLSRFNRGIASIKEILAEQGHTTGYFKRNYVAGLAGYTCKKCGLMASVVVGEARKEVSFIGDALVTVCTSKESA